MTLRFSSVRLEPTAKVKALLMDAYRIEIEEDDNGTFLATCPALPEVTTFGDTVAEARAYAVAAIGEAIAARRQDGRPVPVPE